METNKKLHWENVFATKHEKEVSWYQKKPVTSVNFFEEFAIPKDAAIIEVGGGDSYLIDNLLSLGYSNLTLLDISENAIKRIKQRLGSKAENVKFIVSDILDFTPVEKYDVWHDRASFHFITDENDIKKYTHLMSSSLNENGYFFAGTFSVNGPVKCSGLDITQYSEEKFDTVFSGYLNKVKCFTEDHTTPFNTVQNFIFCIYQNNNEA